MKKVHGMTRNDVAAMAFQTSQNKALNPSYVEAWVKWFDGCPDDTTAAAAPALEIDAALLSDIKRPFAADDLNSCDYCPNSGGVICADDCPPAEYYGADLEEVAVSQTDRIHRAIKALYGDAPPIIEALFGELYQELKTPGYVEALTVTA